MGLCNRCKGETNGKQIFINGIRYDLCDKCLREIDENTSSFVDEISKRIKQDMKSKENHKQKENNFITDLMKYDFQEVLFREEEISRMSQILSRKTKNNPILIGEAGTGKTSIVEYFSTMIKNGEIPRLKGYKVYSLNIGELLSGTKFRGDFEQKVSSLIEKVSDEKTILFIDEIHLVMGAGAGQANEIDLSNLLKPHLARGAMKVIGATTLSEYRVIEKDPAFNRRLQPVKINELNAEQTLTILENIAPEYMDFHSIKINDDMLKHIVDLTDNYIKDRNYPDKAIDVLDEVLAFASTTRNINISVNDESKVVHSMKYLLDNSELTAEQMSNLKSVLTQLNDNKKTEVNKEMVNTVVERMTGIPLTSIEGEEKEKLRKLTDTLKSSIVGQDQAIDVLSRTIKRSRVKITNKNKPTSLFFAGPTGVGKTESAKVLSEVLFGSKDAIIRFDMSEYMEEHTISKLIGSPPGYVGHEDEGQLSEQVRRRPYSVILLDEFEKAHPKISNMFLQILDDGRLTDSKGRIIDFSNTIIIMTSNIGTTEPNKLGFGTNTNNQVNTQTMKALGQMYRPEFLNRIDEIITFNKLTKEDLTQIVELQLKDLKQSLEEKNIQLQLDESVIHYLIDKGYEPENGARPLKRIITKDVEDVLVDYLIESDENNSSLRLSFVEGELKVK